jgi:transcriptional regulator with XRE-family HTH domain
LVDLPWNGGRPRVLQIAGGSLFGRQHMNSLDIFAQNLRRECARFQSIADVCRQAEINRQQFNKYLAGKGLPSAAVLHKICKTLGVSEDVLFKPKDVQFFSSSATPLEMAMLNLQELPGHPVERLEFAGLDFPEGDYFCYFPLPKVPGMLIRSLLRIKRNGANTGFVRLTAYSASASRTTKMISGRHSGIVVANHNDFFFVGLNRYAPFQVSFMSVPRANGSGPTFFSGNALTKSGGNTISSRFCLMKSQETYSTKLNLRKIGIIHEHEAGIESMVMSSLLAKE